MNPWKPWNFNMNFNNNSNRTRFAVICSTLLIVACATSTGTAQSNKPKKGATLGIITSLDRDKITIEVRGEPQNIPVNEISRLLSKTNPVRSVAP
jgi:hypothetical protein